MMYIPDSKNAQESEAEQLKAITKIESEASSADKSPEETKDDILKEAERLKQKMERKYFELTGKENELDLNGLYCDMLRKMMLRTGLLDNKTFEALKEEYKRRGAIEPLLNISEESKGDNSKNISKEAAEESKDGNIKNIPKEAAEFEDMALFFIKHYYDKENMALTIFFEQLSGFMSARQAEKKRSEMGTEMQKDMQAYGNEAERGPNEKKVETYEKMKANKKNAYINQKKNLTKGNAFERIKNSDIYKNFQEFVSDPKISDDLRTIVRKSEKFYADLKDIEMPKNPEGVIRQAGILGINY